jgi:galacturan 1,4-alpha-galacturonidase
MNITNILFENFSGYTSGKYGTAVASLTCSTNPSAVCENIQFKNFTITSPCGNETVILCNGINGDMGVSCVASNTTEATAALSNTCSVPQASISPF